MAIEDSDIIATLYKFNFSGLYGDLNDWSWLSLCIEILYINVSKEFKTMILLMKDVCICISAYTKSLPSV